MPWRNIWHSPCCSSLFPRAGHSAVIQSSTLCEVLGQTNPCRMFAGTLSCGAMQSTCRLNSTQPGRFPRVLKNWTAKAPCFLLCPCYLSEGNEFVLPDLWGTLSHWAQTTGRESLQDCGQLSQPLSLFSVFIQNQIQIQSQIFHIPAYLVAMGSSSSQRYLQKKARRIWERILSSF